MENFLDENSIFSKSNQLLRGVIYKDINRKETFVSVESKFSDPWCNFIIPAVVPDKFNWNEAKETIEKEKERGVQISFYIHNSLVFGYAEILKEKGYKDFGTETYMAINLERPFDGIFEEIIPLDDNSYQEYLDAATACFPEWENEKSYCEYFYNLEKQHGDNIYKTALFKEDNKITSFASIIISPKLQLAYLHNAGTLEKYRRKGHSLMLIEFLCNLALKNGVREIYGLLEKEKSSYYLVKKLGFEQKETFNLFVLDIKQA